MVKAYHLDVSVYHHYYLNVSTKILRAIIFTYHKPSSFSLPKSRGRWWAVKFSGKVFWENAQICDIDFLGTEPDGLLRTNYSSVLTNVGAALHGFHDVMKGKA